MLTLSVHSMNTSPALKPVYSTLRSLHLPLCIGTTSPLNAQDDALGGGLVLSPERCRGLPSKRLQVRVSLLDTLNAAKRLTCGGVLPKLERVGWVLPQDGGPHMLVECVRGVEEPESRSRTCRGGNNDNCYNIGKWEWERGERRRFEPYSMRGDEAEASALGGSTSRLRRRSCSTKTCCTPPSRSHVLRRRYPSRTRRSFAHPLARPYPRGRPHRSRSRSRNPRKRRRLRGNAS
jgi:hypothetical protein